MIWNQIIVYVGKVRKLEAQDTVTLSMLSITFYGVRLTYIVCS